MPPVARFGILFAAVVCCTVHASSQWTPTIPPYVYITSLVTNGDTVLAGTGGGGLLRSSDHGMTWPLPVSWVPTLNVRALAASGGWTYAGNDSGVFVSTDRGGHWTAAREGLAELRVYSLIARDPLVLAGTMNGIFRSTDRGEHWTRADMPSGYSTMIYSFAMNGSTVFAGTSSYHSMVFRSTDNGVTWSTTTALGNVWALAMMGPRVIAGTDNGIRISQDEGTTWGRPLVGPANPIVRSLLVYQGNVFAGTRGGVYVSTDSAATWMSLNSGLSDTITVVNGLTVSGQNVIGGTSGGAWTRALTPFGGVPAPPLLRSPANTAVDQPRTMIFRWSKPDLTIFFRLQVATDPTFVSGMAIDSAGFADTTLVVSGLKANTRYFWRVAAANARGEGPWGAAWWFNTLSQPPLSPSLFWPYARIWVHKGVIPMMWHSVPGATSYRYQVARDSAFASLVVDSTVTDTTCLTRLTQLGLYYWRVQAINELGPGTFSGIRVFAASWPPDLTAPANGASHVPTNVTLRWHPVSEATGYRVTIGLGGSVIGPAVVFNALVTDSSCSVEGLHMNTTYYWQVHVLHDFIEGPASAMWFFDTRADGAIEVFPMAINKIHRYAYSRSYYHESGTKEWDVDSGYVYCRLDNVACPNDSTALWSVSESPYLHHHHWKEDAGGVLLYDSTYWRGSFSTIAMTEMLTGDHELLSESLVWHFPQLPDTQSNHQWPGRTPVYRFWTDTARTITQFEVPPDTGRFQVLRFAAGRGLTDREYRYTSTDGGLTTIRETARWLTSHYPTAVASFEQPATAELLQNFPNPFNPSTTIRYGLPQRVHVTLAVFNTLGQQVAVLHDGEQDAGYHEVRFDAQGLPSGVYFYRLSAGSFTETKRLVLVR